MRLVIKLRAKTISPIGKVSKHTIQGFIYSELKGTRFEDLHNDRGFKYFTYSDLFPSNDFYPGKEKTLLISSPRSGLIETLYDSLRNEKYVYLSDIPLEVASIKKIQLKHNGAFITGSPIVLYKNNKTGTYFSLKREDNFSFFMDRIKENALKKYNSFYNDELEIDEPIFDRYIFKKEVAVGGRKDGREYTVIGSVWGLLHKNSISPELRKFYNFVMDCGLGEKNSMGFGFLNPLKR